MGNLNLGWPATAIVLSAVALAACTTSPGPETRAAPPQPEMPAKVRPADSYVHDVLHDLAGVSRPFAGTNSIGEIRHLVEYGMHQRHHILAVDHDRRALRRPQGDMEDGAFLGDIDLVASKHGVDSRPQTGLLGQF